MRKKKNSGGRAGAGRGKGAIAAIMLMILTLLGLSVVFIQPGTAGRIKKWLGAKNQGNDPAQDSQDKAPGFLTVHYLDVEKCNCVLAESADGHFMLIDAGSNDQEHTDKIVNYLTEKGVENLDYIVLTHPHRDHISAVPDIINRFEVDEILMGDYDVETVGTKTFQRVMNAIEGKDILTTSPEPGETYALGNASFTILTNDDSIETALEDLNECSIGLMLTDGRNRFLFYGDGEEGVEEALLQSGFDLSADVLMVAHHGSNSSTKKKILKEINPDIAVISCGIDGDGEVREPSKKVLKRLKEAGVKVYRTDGDSTVVLTGTDSGIKTGG